MPAADLAAANGSEAQVTLADGIVLSARVARSKEGVVGLTFAQDLASLQKLEEILLQFSATS